MSDKEAIRKFIQLVLEQAHKDDATEVAVGVAQGDATPIRYKVKGQWYDMAPPPAHLRVPIVTELGLLANLAEGPFPKQGTIEAVTDSLPSKWELSVPSAEGEWLLVRVSE